MTLGRKSILKKDFCNNASNENSIKNLKKVTFVFPKEFINPIKINQRKMEILR